MFLLQFLLEACLSVKKSEALVSAIRLMVMILTSCQFQLTTCIRLVMSSFNLLMNGNASVLFFTLLEMQVSYFSPFLFIIMRTGKHFHCDPVVNMTEDVKSYPCYLVSCFLHCSFPDILRFYLSLPLAAVGFRMFVILECFKETFWNKVCRA